MSPDPRTVRALTPGPVEQGRQPVPAAHAEHELGRVLGPGEGQQRLRHVVADDLVVGPAQGLDQAALLGERGRIGAGQAVRLGDVHREEVAAGRAGGDPGRAPDQRVALGSPGERDHHPFPRFPDPVDVVRRPVPLQPLVDLVGQPEQGEFAKRGQVPGAEVVRQRRVDLLRRVDVAVGHPAAQCLRRHVDELDLVGGADDRVGDGFPLRHAGDLLDHVVQGREMLDVDVRDDVDAGLEQFLHVLPALLVPRSRDVRVRELVDQRDLGPARQHGVDVHLLKGRAAVGQVLARHRPLGPRSARRCAAGRASPRTPRRRRCRARRAGGPRRAWRRSCPLQERPDGKKVLDQISRQTGGRLFEVSMKLPIEQIYSQIQDELRNQYNLGYTPDRTDATADYHKIHLTTKQKDLVVQARDGYYSGP